MCSLQGENSDGTYEIKISDLYNSDFDGVFDYRWKCIFYKR